MLPSALECLHHLLPFLSLSCQPRIHSTLETSMA
ncbi:rCG44067 [Rattus norvegicus]|uniref:RCG44067 n=1 Tax=Rattus norvegicus TaxID=10116 RepID=A6J7L3_RAT|nr:rCG44067 [Rattus norvegicus]